MKTKLEIIAEFKAAHPTIRTGDDSAGYTDLSKAEYDATISLWADSTLEQLKAEAAEEAAAEQAATQKAALLARLGITADEAKLLLG
jgi:hypothetical protein